MAGNREQTLAFKVSVEYVQSLNELCNLLECGRSDVLRLAVAEFVRFNMSDAGVLAATKINLF